MAKMTQEMIDNIQNYGDQIETLADFVTAVRQNIGMYIGSRGNKGFINMIREIFQNSEDENNKESSPCDMVIISYDERTNTVIVEDNGRGIPFDNMIRIFASQHTSSNYNKKPGEYSSGLHGVGAKVTNALSSKFIVESYILGKARKVEFNEGYPWDKGEVEIPNPDNKQGCRITFVPSYEALGDITITWKDVYNLVKLIVPLSKIGSVVYFNAIDSTGKEYQEKIVNEDGVMTYLIERTTSPLIAPIHLFEDNGTMKMDISFTYDADEMSGEDLIAFSNCCPTSAGTHINGFYQGLSKYFVTYMNKVFLANSKSKITIVPSDIKAGLKVVISVAHLNPVFNGQAKEILSNEDMEPFVRNGVVKGLEEWAKYNPNDLAKICKYIKDIAEIRLKADKEKIKLTNKYTSSALTGLPDKYVAPTGKNHLELWICEGDSAAGTLKNNRINSFQGYFPIRGKIPNAFDTSKEKFLGNAEIAGIISIIGAGYGKNCDPDKSKFDKIIFGVDADSDGDHISSLLLAFFMIYMRKMVEAGKVYKSMPPLYGLEVKKGNNIYFRDRLSYMKYVQKEFSKNNTVEDINKKKLSPDALSKILYMNIDYAYELEKVANRYAINPVLLESLLTLKDKDIKQIEKSLKPLYRFLNYNIVNGCAVIEGIVDRSYQTIIMNDKLINDCSEVLNIMNKNTSLAYYINGKLSSVYELMHSFDLSSPKSIQRFKGLGEMDGKRLFDSTVDPEKRTLVRYTVEDAQKELETMRFLNDNKIKLLEDVQVSRFDIMG